MAKTSCSGPYSSLITQYVEYKRSLGFKMGDTEERLRRLDNMAKQMGLEAGAIPKSLMDEWCKPTNAESNYNRYVRISVVRGFSSYLCLMGYDSYVPRLPRFRSSFTPHIFTSREMAAIFRECDRLSNKRKYTYSIYSAMPVLIRMLYGTGIRIGEAVGLIHGDVDLNAGTLYLRETKNGCDRIVPMSLSLREVCKDYVAFKESRGIPVDAECDFFTSYDGTKKLLPGTVYEVFRTVLQRAGLAHGGRSKGPRIHDLRHTFCVNALVKMSEAGSDLYCSMPVLMTYVGHKSLEATNRYVRLTQELYPGVLTKLDETYRHVFPELGKDLETTEDYEND